MAFYGGGVNSRRSAARGQQQPLPPVDPPRIHSGSPLSPVSHPAPAQSTNPFAQRPAAKPVSYESRGAAPPAAGPIGEGSTVARRASSNPFARAVDSESSLPNSNERLQSTDRVDLSETGATFLSDSLVTGLACRLIGNGAPLVTLNLRGCGLQAGQLQSLARALEASSSLTSLNLAFNALGSVAAAAFAEALKFNGFLKFFDLSSVKLNSQGAAHLAAGLAQNRALQTLKLSHNPIGNDGALALAHGLRKNSTLATLALDNAWIGASGAAALGAALSSSSNGNSGEYSNISGLRTLDLQNNEIDVTSAEALGESLSSARRLEALHLNNDHPPLLVQQLRRPPVSKAHVRSNHRSSHSSSVLASAGIHLDLSGRAMDAVEAIVAMRLLGQGLSDIEVTANGVTEEDNGAVLKGASVLSSSSSLSWMAEPKDKLALEPVIGAGAMVSATGSAAISSPDWSLCPAINRGTETDFPHALVSVKMNDATLSGLDALGRGKRSNRALALLGNLAWGASGDTLQTLNLAGNDLTCDELTALLGLNGLPPSLRSLNLSRNRLDGHAAAALARSLVLPYDNNAYGTSAAPTTDRGFSSSIGGPLGARGAATRPNAAPAATTQAYQSITSGASATGGSSLKRLSLYQLELSDNPALLPGLTVCRTLANALVHPRGPQHLRKLGLANCGLKPEGVAEFANAIAASARGDAPTSAAAEGGAAGWPLAWLDLSRNPALAPEGAMSPVLSALASAIATTTEAMLQGDIKARSSSNSSGSGNRSAPKIQGGYFLHPQWGLQSAGAAQGAAMERFCFSSLTLASFDLSPNLTCLSVSGIGLNAGDAAVIGALLPHHTHLQTLLLDDNRHLFAGAAGESAACLLMRGLELSGTLRRVSMRRCGLQAKDAATQLAHLGEQKPGLLVRCLPALPDLPHALRRRFEILAQNVDFDTPDVVPLGTSAAAPQISSSSSSIPLAVAVTAMPPPPNHAYPQARCVTISSSSSSSANATTASRTLPRSRSRLVDEHPTLRPGSALAPRMGRLHVIGDRGVGKAALVAALVRTWPQSLTASEEQFEGPKGSERGNGGVAAASGSSDVAFSTHFSGGAGSNYHHRSWFGAVGSSSDASHLQGGDAWAGPIHVTRGFAPLSTKEAPFSCWVHRASLLGSTSPSSLNSATASAGASAASSVSGGASARAMALHSRREPFICSLRPLSMWADAVVVVVVDLTMDRRRLHTALKRHLKLLQAAAPENATVMVVGSCSDKMGKLGSDYLAQLVETVNEELLTKCITSSSSVQEIETASSQAAPDAAPTAAAAAPTGTSAESAPPSPSPSPSSSLSAVPLKRATGPPLPVSLFVAADCRKSQSSGVKKLRQALADEHKRLRERLKIPAAPLTDKVYTLLQKWRSEPVLPLVFTAMATSGAGTGTGGALRGVPGVERGGWNGDSTPLVAVAQVLDRCRVELYPGLSRRELLAMLRTLYKSGALLLVEGLDPDRAHLIEKLKARQNNSSSSSSNGGGHGGGGGAASSLDTCFVILDEGWVFSHLIASVVDDNQPWAATAQPHALGATVGVPLHEARSAVAAVLFGNTVATAMAEAAATSSTSTPGDGFSCWRGNSGQLIDDCLGLLGAWELASIVETSTSATPSSSSATPLTRVLVLGSPAAVACLEPMPLLAQRPQEDKEEAAKPSLEGPISDAAEATTDEAGVTADAAVDSDVADPSSDNDGDDNNVDDDNDNDFDEDVKDHDRWVRSVRFAVTSPLGGLGPGGFARLQARLTHALAGVGTGWHASSPGTTDIAGGRAPESSSADKLAVPVSAVNGQEGSSNDYTASKESVLVWSDALLVQHLCDQWGRKAQVLVQAAPDESVDVLVRLLPQEQNNEDGEGDDDDDAAAEAMTSLSVLFEKVIAVVDGFSLSLRTLTLTPYRDLSSNHQKVSVWDCAPRFRVAQALDAPPKPVFERRAVVPSPRRQLTKATELSNEGTAGLTHSSGGEGDRESGGASDALTVAAAAALDPPPVAYRENWSVAGDLLASWGDIKYGTLAVEQRVRCQGVGTYEILLPHPDALDFEELFAKPGSYLAHALSMSSPTDAAAKEPTNDDSMNTKKTQASKAACLVVSDAAAPSPASASSGTAPEVSPTPADVVVTAISTFDGHLRNLKGLAVTAISEQPWDPLCHNKPQCLSAEHAKTALASLRYPLYLTLVDPEEKVSEKDLAAAVSSSIEGRTVASSTSAASSDASPSHSSTGASESKRDDASESELATNHRVLRMVIVATTRTLSQAPLKEGGSREFRWSGDAAPSSVLQWGVSIVETKPSVAQGSPFGEKMEVHIQDFRVVAHYSLPAVDARNLLYALTNTPSARSSSPAAAADSIQDEVLVYVHGFLTPFNNAVKSACLFSRCFDNRPVVLFTWPSDPELVASSWLLTKVMSEFERNYTHAEQHMYGSINPLCELARTLFAWGQGNNLSISAGSSSSSALAVASSTTTDSPGDSDGDLKGSFRLQWKAHSMGNYLLLNAIDRLSWLDIAQPTSSTASTATSATMSNNGSTNTRSTVGAIFGGGLILSAPDVPTWFFTELLQRVTTSTTATAAGGGSHLTRILHLFSASDVAVESGRLRRQVPGPCPGGAAVLSNYGNRSIEAVSCAGAFTTLAGHDYGQADGACLLDQRDFLNGVPAQRRLLDWVPPSQRQPQQQQPQAVDHAEGGEHSGYWQLRPAR